jgi:sugar/nucleoside kinase (ribokinase family)
LLKEKRCKIGGVTLGDKGLLWYDEKGVVGTMPALHVPKEEIIDTNGAGDVFHGAYVYSRIVHPNAPWAEHFRFARAASAHAIRYLGNEARLPSVTQVQETERSYRPAAAA